MLRNPPSMPAPEPQEEEEPSQGEGETVAVTEENALKYEQAADYLEKEARGETDPQTRKNLRARAKHTRAFAAELRQILANSQRREAKVEEILGKQK